MLDDNKNIHGIDNTKLKKLALFDFDGTITTKDSLVDFIQFAVGKATYYKGLAKLSIMLTQYTLRIIPNHTAKEKLIGHFFQGWNTSDFKKIANKYGLSKIDKIIRPKALEKIDWHKQQGHKIIIVSASMKCWLQSWCDKNKIELISTQLEIKDKKITGKFATKNCYGIEKVNRIKELYTLDDYDYIYAYGDSSGDKELLALADKSVYKPFRTN